MILNATSEYRVVFLFPFESPQLFKRIFYLKQINVITRGPLRAEGPEQLPPFPPLIGPWLRMLLNSAKSKCKHDISNIGGEATASFAFPNIHPCWQHNRKHSVVLFYFHALLLIRKKTSGCVVAPFLKLCAHTITVLRVTQIVRGCCRATMLLPCCMKALKRSTWSSNGPDQDWYIRHLRKGQAYSYKRQKLRA